MKKTPSECPVCGAEVPPGALACPECGADERTGWDEESTRYDGLDLPGQEEDDLRESRTGSSGKSLFWSICGGLVLLAFLWLLFR